MSTKAVATNGVDGLRKAAILLVQLGHERASTVLSQMRESEVEELVAEIARLREVGTDVGDGVMEEFHGIATARQYSVQGGLGFARELLESGMGTEKAREIMGRLEAAISEMPFQQLRRTEGRQLLTFLGDEHPQTIALVLAHLSADQASLLLASMKPELQAEIAHRIATMDRTSPDVVRKVEAVLQRRMSSILTPTDLSTVGGIDPLIEIMNRSDRATERLILEGLETIDPALAEEIRAQMFMFEDITTLEDRAIQLVLRQVDSAELATALKGVAPAVRDKVLRNLSERAAEMLADEIDMLGPVRLSVVEESQAKIVQVIRGLEESGQIQIQRSGDDDAFVS